MAFINKKRRKRGVFSIDFPIGHFVLFLIPSPRARKPKPRRIMVEGSATATGALSTNLSPLLK
jgi:hypothetical protein